MNADALIEALKMKPHPEGGHYAETFRDQTGANGRAHCTAIYFLLRAGERSHWHRVDASEIWLWHAGAPLELEIEGQDRTVLGADVLAGQKPQAIVPPHAWQAAKSIGEWTLVSCIVAPGFEFSGFELAPPEWRPA